MKILSCAKVQFFIVQLLHLYFYSEKLFAILPKKYMNILNNNKNSKCILVQKSNFLVVFIVLQKEKWSINNNAFFIIASTKRFSWSLFLSVTKEKGMAIWMKVFSWVFCKKTKEFVEIEWYELGKRYNLLYVTEVDILSWALINSIMFWLFLK